MRIYLALLNVKCFLQESGCVGQALMEERLILQQQQMEDDQRWLEQEESIMVKHKHRDIHIRDICVFRKKRHLQ